MGIFGSLGTKRFLSEYWQKKPLLLRAALPGFTCPISADELAGLALEEEVEARIVLERSSHGAWELRNGPFKRAEFRRLPKTHWTLLVQAVDQWVPAIAGLREHFDFLPSWRFDDIMISYASDQGGVGPHFDYYDVFLLQASGRRRWQLGGLCDANTPLRDDTPLRILQRFTTNAEYLLEPGDMLYLPPGIAHLGVAEGECMTISVGFRAPSHADLLVEVASAAAAQLAEDCRYRDVAIAGGGHIPEPAVRELQRVVRELADDRELIRDWFGRYMTERKYPELEIAAEDDAGDWLQRLRSGGSLLRHPASRFAWSEANGGRLYVDGESFCCDALTARIIADAGTLDRKCLKDVIKRKAGRELIAVLYRSGALHF